MINETKARGSNKPIIISAVAILLGITAIIVNLDKPIKEPVVEPPRTDVYEELGEGQTEMFTYTYEDNLVTITGFNRAYEASEDFSTELVIPELINGKTVNQIGENAFMREEFQLDGIRFPAIKSVELPKGIVRIGKGAFYQNELSSFDFPEGIEVIEESVFSKNLFKEFDFKNVKIIERAAFSGNKFQFITFGDKIEEIGGSAFENNGLKSVIMTDSVVKIGSYSFYGNEIIELKLSNNIEVIPSRAFMGLQLTNIDLPSQLKVIDSYAFHNSKLESFHAPEHLEKIHNNAFMNSPIAEFTFNEGLISIGTQAFWQSEATELILPLTLELVGAQAFYPGFMKPSLETIELSRNTVLTFLRGQDPFSASGAPNKDFIYRD